jgi:hypothetical protein
MNLQIRHNCLTRHFCKVRFTFSSTRLPRIQNFSFIRREGPLGSDSRWNHYYNLTAMYRPTAFLCRFNLKVFCIWELKPGHKADHQFLPSSRSEIGRDLHHSFRMYGAYTAMISLLTAIWLSPGGSSTVHIYT